MYTWPHNLENSHICLLADPHNPTCPDLTDLISESISSSSRSPGRSCQISSVEINMSDFAQLSRNVPFLWSDQEDRGGHDV